MNLRDDERLVTVDGDEYVVTRSVAKMQIVKPNDGEHAVAAKASEEFWQDGVNPDIVWCQFILDSEGENQNWDYMPRPVLMKSYASAKWKPFDMDHLIKEEASLVFMDKKSPPVKNSIFGVMTNSRLADSTGSILSPKKLKELKSSDLFGRPDEDKLCVVGYAALWNFIFPQTVSDVIAYAVDGHMHVSMERWIKKFDFLYRDAEGKLKAISKKDAIDNGYFDSWVDHKEINGYPILRRSLDFVYGGVAATMIPANKLSTFIGGEASTVPTQAVANNAFLEKILNRHNELHAAYGLPCDAAQKRAIEREHLWIHKCLASFDDKTSQ